MYRFFMRSLGLLLLLILGGAAVILFGTRQKVDEVNFANGLTKIDAADAAAQFVEDPNLTDIKEGQNRQIIWAGAEGAKTDLTILYVHGYSATLQEIRPVPDNVAGALGANLVYTRLTGHGRTSAAMADVHVNDWMTDLAQALSVARAIGDRIIIISTSTGGTLTAAGLPSADAMANVAGIVFVAPNFALVNPIANLAKLPYFEKWGPVLAGKNRSFEPRNAEQEIYWTTSYPTRSVVPMMRLIDYVEKVDFAATNIPALFYFMDEDKVVDAKTTRQVMAKWGGPVSVINPTLAEGDDSYAHVIAGDIMSPSQTAPASQAMIDWIKGLQ